MQQCLSPRLTLWCSNPRSGEVYSVQHNVIKFVSDLRHVGGFLQFPLLIKLTHCHHHITEILLKVALNTKKPNNHSLPRWFTKFFLVHYVCWRINTYLKHIDDLELLSHHLNLHENGQCHFILWFNYDHTSISYNCLFHHW